MTYRRGMYTIIRYGHHIERVVEVMYEGFREGIEKVEREWIEAVVGSISGSYTSKHLSAMSWFCHCLTRTKLRFIGRSQRFGRIGERVYLSIAFTKFVESDMIRTTNLMRSQYSQYHDHRVRELGQTGLSWQSSERNLAALSIQHPGHARWE